MSTDFLSDWVQTQTHFPECLLPSNLEEHRAVRLERAQNQENLRVFGDSSRFVAWETGLTLETGQPLAQLWGWRADGDSLTALLEESRSELASNILLWVREPDGEPHSSRLEGQGFELYRRRYILHPKVHDLSGPRTAKLRLRSATELDRAAICSIAVNQVSYTVPESFAKEVENIQRHTMERFNSMDISENSPFDIFLAEDRTSLRPLGYILLSAGESGTVYLDDLAVKRDSWGGYVGHFMVRSVENLLSELGLSLLFTDIAQANRRSHLTATRQLKFVPNLEYWIRFP